jgi:hypothetical protein
MKPNLSPKLIISYVGSAPVLRIKNNGILGLERTLLKDSSKIYGNPLVESMSTKVSPSGKTLRIKDRIAISTLSGLKHLRTKSF